jgi:glycerate dehydrogenase
MRALSFAHELLCYDATRAHEVAARIAGADVVTTNKAPIDAHAVAEAESLGLVAVAATGYDNIDVTACAAHGVTVSNIRQYAVNTVPEHTFALVLTLRRNLLAYRKAVREGAWTSCGQFSFFEFPIHDLAGSTLGIIGDGAIGQAVAALGKAFAMRVFFASYKGINGMGPLYTPFDDVLQQSDVITLHCPLSPSTRNLIGAREFELMVRKPLVINTARGGLIDEEALCKALIGGQIGGAAFDVMAAEPPHPNHPFMKLLDRPDFILTPHIAWASAEATQALADQLVENIEAFWRAQPRNVVS